MDYERLYSVEQKHFWHRTRKQTILAVAKELVKELPRNYQVLEIGCGTGDVLQSLQRICSGGKVTGVDVDSEALGYARRRVTCQLIQGDINSLQLGRFNLICMFDVLEHIRTDLALLKFLLDNCLEKEGFLLLTVPANPSLWSDFDIYSGHYRRYDSKALKTNLELVGFHVKYLTKFMSLTYPILWMKRKLKWGSASAELKVMPLINSFMLLLFRLETLLIKGRHHLPFGSSILVVAQKT